MLIGVLIADAGMTLARDSVSGSSDELEVLSFPNLEQALNIELDHLPGLGEIDLGRVSAANMCDPAQRRFFLYGTCQEAVMQVQSCGAVSFE